MAVSAFLKGVFHKKGGGYDGDLPRASVEPPPMVTESSRISRQKSEACFLNHLFSDSNSAQLTVAQKLVQQNVQRDLSKPEHRKTAVPRLPSVIPKLLRSLRDPDSSIRDYVVIVNKDPAMSAAVLKLANSAYFNPVAKPIDDIERAIIKLGLSGLRSVLSAAVMQPIVRKDSPYYTHTGQRLWAHSLNCALICDIVGNERKLERYKAYLTGLVHDIGKITIFSELCKQYQRNGDLNPGYRAFAPMLRHKATVLSHLIAKDWELPEDICLALEEQIDIEQGKEVTRYGQLLFQANIIAEIYTITTEAQRTKCTQLLRDFDMPVDLFQQLDRIANET